MVLEGKPTPTCTHIGERGHAHSSDGCSSKTGVSVNYVFQQARKMS
jgi:hypothetical protein